MCFVFCRRSLTKEKPNMSSTLTEAFSPSPRTFSSSTMPGPVILPGPAPAHRARSHGNGPIQAKPYTPPVASAASDHVQSVSGTDSAPVPIQRAKSLEGVFSGTPQMSAVLPRGFRRSETTSRLSTGVTPRPFSSKTSRMSMPARFYSVSVFRQLSCFPQNDVCVVHFFFHECLCSSIRVPACCFF